MQKVKLTKLFKNSSTFLLILLFVFSFTTSNLTAENVPVKKANYNLAARFSPEKLKKVVFSTSLRPHWLKNSSRFWYTYETTNGKKWYIINPANNTKRTIFDSTVMAAELTRLTKDPYEAKHLPITKIKFIKNNKSIYFKVKKNKYVLEVESKKLKKSKPKNKSEKDKNNKDEKSQIQKATDEARKHHHFEYNLSSKKLTLLKQYSPKPKKPAWANISPDGKYIVFSKHYNLFYMTKSDYNKWLANPKDKTIKEIQVTKDGMENFGYGGMVYGGETNVDKKKNKDKHKTAYIVWAPDSSKFVIQRTDSREVSDLWVINSIANPRPTLQSYKYHMPGEKNAPQSSLHIINLKSNTNTKVKAERFQDQTLSVMRANRKKDTYDDDYVASLWLSKSSDKVFFYRSSRDLKRIDICCADTGTGEVKVLIEERLNTYLETRSLGFINNGKELIHWSERDGWAHFYLFDGNGKLKRQLTSGPWHCSNIEGIDEKNRILYFTANGREKNEDPYYNHLYKVNLDGSGLTLLNKGNFNHSSNMSDSKKFFIDNYSRVNTTPETILMSSSGKTLMKLETADLSRLFEIGYKYPEPFKAKADDGITDIFGVMYKPFDFDPQKKYPIIAYVYPGPQSEAVGKSFSTRMDRTDRLAQFGFIVVTLGNRGGHPNRSKWYHNYGYGNLRNYGLADKKSVIEQLAIRHPFVNVNKVGIYGHSGGGFMSTAAMLVYPDFFKVAVSSAGNHENNIYNRWWSEKHHGVDEITDDKGKVSFKYKIDKNSEIAKNLKGRLLICTGDIDNNVHPGNTIRLANALIKANKRFDFFVFPGKRHRIGSMTKYFFWLRADYFCKHLIGNFTDSVDMVELNQEIEQN